MSAERERAILPTDRVVLEAVDARDLGALLTWVKIRYGAVQRCTDEKHREHVLKPALASVEAGVFAVAALRSEPQGLSPGTAIEGERIEGVAHKGSSPIWRFIVNPDPADGSLDGFVPATLVLHAPAPSHESSVSDQSDP